MDTIDTKIIVLAAIVVGLLIPSMIFMIYVFRKASNRDKWQEDVVASHKDLAKQGNWYRVLFASGKRFNSIWKVFPWESTGILFFEQHKITLVKMKGANEHRYYYFEPEQSVLSWIGKSIWPNGAISWFCLTQGNEKYYFTADSGVTIVNSKRLTRDIYNQMKLVYPGMLVTDENAG